MLVRIQQIFLIGERTLRLGHASTKTTSLIRARASRWTIAGLRANAAGRRWPQRGLRAVGFPWAATIAVRRRVRADSAGPTPK
jgi:hypothetical protein